MLRGKPEEVLPKVWKDWKITRLCFEVDTEDYAKERDSKIKAAAKKAGAWQAHSTEPSSGCPWLLISGPAHRRNAPFRSLASFEQCKHI